MDTSLLWRAALGQLMAVAALFLLLLALPLSENFFRDHGAVIGPASWLGCSAVTGKALSLEIWTTLRAAVASGVVAGVAGVLLSHSFGLVVGIVVFGAVAAARGRRRLTERAPAIGVP